jgi:hypothetical protein
MNPHRNESTNSSLPTLGSAAAGFSLMFAIAAFPQAGLIWTIASNTGLAQALRAVYLLVPGFLWLTIPIGWAGALVMLCAPPGYRERTKHIRGSHALRWLVAVLFSSAIVTLPLFGFQQSNNQLFRTLYAQAAGLDVPSPSLAELPSSTLREVAITSSRSQAWAVRHQLYFPWSAWAYPLVIAGLALSLARLIGLATASTRFAALVGVTVLTLLPLWNLVYIDILPPTLAALVSLSLPIALYVCLTAAFWKLGTLRQAQTNDLVSIGMLWRFLRGRWHTVLSLTVPALASIIIFIAAVAMLLNLSQTRIAYSGTVSPMTRGRTELLTDDVFLLSDGRPSDGRAASALVVTLETAQMNYREMKLRCIVTASMWPSTAANLIDSNAESIAQQTLGVYRLRPDYSKEQLQLQIKSASSGTAQRISIPLEDVFNGNPATAASGWTSAIDILADVADFDSNSYPSDWYLFDVQLSAQLPAGVRQVPAGEKDFRLPFQTFRRKARSMRTAVVETWPSEDDRLLVRVSRSSEFVLFVYAMSLLPLLLGTLILTSISVTRRHRLTNDAVGWMIGAMLSVLPLRAVLVPAEIEGLTRVDLLLSCGIGLAIAGAILKYSRRLLGQGSQ